ncbi:MAG: Mut7-C RNAse domain-containing protein [Thermoplasmatales archaeon]
MIIADSMLGKLSTYLRLLGYDVEYVTNDKDDSFIMEKSRTSLVLTRDKALHQRIPSSILVKAYDPREQIREIFPKLPKPEHSSLELCSICGLKTEEVKSRDGLPDYVNKTAEKIFYCKRCDKYYWEGSHTKNFMEMMRRLGIEV